MNCTRSHIILLLTALLVATSLGSCRTWERFTSTSTTSETTDSTATHTTTRLVEVRDCTHTPSPVSIRLALDSLPIRAGHSTAAYDSATGALLRLYRTELGRLIARLDYKPPPIIIQGAIQKEQQNEKTATSASTEKETASRAESEKKTRSGSSRFAWGVAIGLLVVLLALFALVFFR